MAMDKEREALVERLRGVGSRTIPKPYDEDRHYSAAEIERLEQDAATISEAIAALTAQQEPGEGVHIIFDGPPSHESGRFVEVETPDGRSISWGRWEQRGKYWHLIAPPSGVQEGMLRAADICKEHAEHIRQNASALLAMGKDYEEKYGDRQSIVEARCRKLCAMYLAEITDDITRAAEQVDAEGQPTDGRASMQAELGAALGSALSHYKSGDMQACAASLVRIVDLFRDAAKEPRK